MTTSSVLAAVTALLALGGCVTVPQGPTVMVMPGAGKPFDVFQADMGACQQFAQASISGPTQAAHSNAGANVAGSAVAGAAVGALLGAATGNASAGAAWGAGTGVLMGSTAAGGSGAVSSHTLQRQYDIAYMQCMYAHGNQVPSYVSQRSSRTSSAPPHARYGAPPYAMTPPPNTPAPTGYSSPAGYGAPPNAATPPPNTPPPPGTSAPATN